MLGVSCWGEGIRDWPWEATGISPGGRSTRLPGGRSLLPFTSLPASPMAAMPRCPRGVRRMCKNLSSPTPFTALALHWYSLPPKPNFLVRACVRACVFVLLRFGRFGPFYVSFAALLLRLWMKGWGIEVWLVQLVARFCLCRFCGLGQWGHANCFGHAFLGWLSSICCCRLLTELLICSRDVHILDSNMLIGWISRTKCIPKVCTLCVWSHC